MITIPTADLTGLLGDVTPFAGTDDQVPQLHCVRLEWDGETLHALTTDRYRIGWSRWAPGDATPGEEVQDDLFTEWGSGDDPWTATIDLPDAVELAKVFKLPTKEGRTPLTVDYEADRARLTVKRSRDTGYSAITITVEDLAPGVQTPDVRKLLANANGATPVGLVAYTPKYLADFAKVRPHGPLELTFTGAETATHVRIGERFTGAIMPVRAGE